LFRFVVFSCHCLALLGEGVDLVLNYVCEKTGKLHTRHPQLPV
jgi:hypothetical protein